MFPSRTSERGGKGDCVKEGGGEEYDETKPQCYQLRRDETSMASPLAGRRVWALRFMGLDLD